MFNVDRFVSGLHDYIGRALSPIARRIEVLEQRAPVPGPKGEKGDVPDAETVRSVIREAVEDSFAEFAEAVEKVFVTGLKQ